VERGRQAGEWGATMPARSGAHGGRAGERSLCQQASRDPWGGEPQSGRRETAGAGGREKGLKLRSLFRGVLLKSCVLARLLYESGAAKVYQAKTTRKALTAYFAEREIAWLCTNCERWRSQPFSVHGVPPAHAGLDGIARERLGSRRLASGPRLSFFCVAFFTRGRESELRPSL
jgi:hypothetical protein